MKNTSFIDEQSHGVFIISTTPFAKDGSIDFDSVDSLVEFYIEKRVSGITILGMMGEANKLCANESENFVKHVIKRVNNRVPVVVGVSNVGLQNLVRLSQFSMDSGCAGMASHRSNLESKIGIPVIDPVQAAVSMAIHRVISKSQNYTKL